MADVGRHQGRPPLSAWDTIVVGGGPAGLSAALILGRCRRRVMVCDDGRPRNQASRHVHGLLGRDGIGPAELRRAGRAEVTAVGVTLRDTSVLDVRRIGDDRFEIELVNGERQEARSLILATGVVDRTPPVPGFHQLYGRGIWHCPICDGWEARDRPIGVYARGQEAVDFALGMTAWSDDVILFTDGDSVDQAALAAGGVALRPERGARFQGDDRGLRGVELAGGELVPRAALFFHLGVEQRSPLAASLGCHFDRQGAVVVSPHGERSGVPGVWVVGDASEDAQLVAVAIAEGAKAGLSVHKALRRTSP